ncbi:MAG TPA: hypothetical protein VFP17_03460 [Solirubrobacterales bacterium]|nr:hypothetical protein [Solirubrobacterales bacterium]
MVSTFVFFSRKRIWEAKEKMYRLITAIGMAAAVCFALGCGSSGSDGTAANETVSKPLTKAEYIKQATAICMENSKSRNADYGTWSKKYEADPGGPNAHFAEAIEEVVVPSVGDKVEELEELPAPEADAEELATMIDSLSQAQKNLEQAGHGGVGEADVQQFESESAKYKRMAADYGLGACTTP